MPTERSIIYTKIIQHLLANELSVKAQRTLKKIIISSRWKRKVVSVVEQQQQQQQQQPMLSNFNLTD